MNDIPQTTSERAAAVVRDVAKIVGLILVGTVSRGLCGLIAGIATMFLFRSYSANVLGGLSPLIYFLLAGLYFCAGGAAVWGCLGFLDGATKALRFTLIERKGLAFITSNMSGMVLGLIQKKGAGQRGIGYEALKVVLEKFYKKDTAQAVLAGKTAPEKANPIFVSRLLIWFITRKLAGKLLLMIKQRFDEKGGNMTAAEIKELIIDAGNIAGQEILDEMHSGKATLFYLFILAHLALPFITVFIILKTR